MSRKLTYDTYLFGAAMLIVVVGMVMIYSASAIITMQKVGSDNPYYFITKQFVWLVAGSAVMVTLMRLDVVRLSDRRIIYAGVVMALLALVISLVLSQFTGAHHWVVFPKFPLLPSDFAKSLLILL